jgi:hypothetical protein
VSDNNVTSETALAKAERELIPDVDLNGKPHCRVEYAKQLDNEPRGCSIQAMAAAFGVDQVDIWRWRWANPIFGIAYRKCIDRWRAHNMSRRAEIIDIVREEGDRRMAYRPEMLEILERYVAECPDVAMTKHSIALALGVASSTLDRWRGLKSDGVADEIIRGAGDTFLEFWCLVQQLPDRILARAFNQSAANEIRDRVLSLLAQHHGGYTDKSEQRINQRVIFETVNCHDMVTDEQWRKQG